ncbi:MAG: hypothetical protein M3Z19_03885 [Chloroflexota bacterium]|nr:hypothetical protein [Chloroflexota bacterium]
MADNGMTRREAMKAALKAGAYVAPAMLTMAVPGGAAAASPAPPTVAVSPPSGPATGPTGRTIFTFVGAGFTPNTTFTYIVQQSPAFVVTRFPVTSDAAGTITGLANPTFIFPTGAYTLLILSAGGATLAMTTFTVTP